MGLPVVRSWSWEFWTGARRIDRVRCQAVGMTAVRRETQATMADMEAVPGAIPAQATATPATPATVSGSGNGSGADRRPGRGRARTPRDGHLLLGSPLGDVREPADRLTPLRGAVAGRDGVRRRLRIVRAGSRGVPSGRDDSTGRSSGEAVRPLAASGGTGSALGIGTRAESRALHPVVGIWPSTGHLFQEARDREPGDTMGSGLTAGGSR